GQGGKPVVVCGPGSEALGALGCLCAMRCGCDYGYVLTSGDACVSAMHSADIIALQSGGEGEGEGGEKGDRKSGGRRWLRELAASAVVFSDTETEGEREWGERDTLCTEAEECCVRTGAALVHVHHGCRDTTPTPPYPVVDIQVPSPSECAASVSPSPAAVIRVYLPTPIDAPHPEEPTVCVHSLDPSLAVLLGGMLGASIPRIIKSGSATPLPMSDVVDGCVEALHAVCAERDTLDTAALAAVPQALALHMQSLYKASVSHN
ncbi:hypothetical protein KIPB_015020, partial [Kipferlia bialata]